MVSDRTWIPQDHVQLLSQEGEIKSQESVNAPVAILGMPRVGLHLSFNLTE